MKITKSHIPLPERFPFNSTKAVIKPSHSSELTYHWHECLEITYVSSGKGIYYVNGQSFTMEPGDVILFNNIEPHAWRALPPDPMIQPVIVFHPSLIWSGSENLFDYEYLSPFWERCTTFSNKLPSGHPVTNKIFKLLAQIVEEHASKPTGHHLMIKAKLLEIMTLLIRHFQDDSKKAEPLSNKRDRLHRIQQVIEYIHNNFTLPLRLEDAAAIACMNPNYFSTVFKEALGVSFSEYLARLRTSKATTLIRTTDRTLTDIAMDCGFNTMSNFYRTYKKHVGKNPSELRKPRPKV